MAADSGWSLRNYKWISIGFILLLGALLWFTPRGATGQSIEFGEDGHSFKVEAHPEAGSLSLFHIGKSGALSGNPSITYWSSNGAIQSFELKASSANPRGQAVSVFTAPLDPGQGSIVGLEVTLRFKDSGSPRIFRWQKGDASEPAATAPGR